ncbi:thioredoxin family protein [Candidatus Parcubacteria bacterium]|nr:TM0996/MTH895 family glutaredoxin-like protein [Patescibacteria group bacterium]MBU4309312.1 TM0996/MTH895 family glutaredoxin-like protein [Patescibacteria group bacterium]MBU4432289.1 TM0996/MTH895 family glutaredoxin-like protein [Patescibacteria group bacterium]MBU4577673.1 TM0996/MTH895 family glutaredoxin-like protein [Patescibacteria group bacterium]MCG2697359.1 thioredoxin family protein [Candidatus Parcubacteria bacterium]
MNIQVLGTGCPTCKKLYERTRQAAIELNLEVEVEYINDMEKILALGVMSSPVLVIDGKVITAGQFPSLEKIKELLGSNKKKKPDVRIGTCACGNDRW